MLVLMTLTVLIFIIVLTFIVLKVCLITPQLKEGLRVLPPLEFRGRGDIGSCKVVNFLRIAS